MVFEDSLQTLLRRFLWLTIIYRTFHVALNEELKSKQIKIIRTDRYPTFVTVYLMFQKTQVYNAPEKDFLSLTKRSTSNKSSTRDLSTDNAKPQLKQTVGFGTLVMGVTLWLTIAN